MCARILVVDDDFRKRDLLRIYLAPHGHILIEAVDGEEGLALARQQPPDLVIADLIMPRMNGHTFCKELRADPHLTDIPIAICSGMTMEEIQAIATDCDINYVIPYSPDLPTDAPRVVEAALAGDPDPLAIKPLPLAGQLKDVKARLEALCAKLPFV